MITTQQKVLVLLEGERAIQERWYKDKVFETDAPQEYAEDEKEKFLVTFPYPNMNGKLHMGHAFSLSKCEFAIGFNKLMGKRCLFPFGFHCTGMAIKTCADKLKMEMHDFGYPPNFPTSTQEEQTTSVAEECEIKDPSKEGSSKYQWQIMKSLGLENEEIKQFADPLQWLEYFPPIAVKDLKSLGLKIDWRRSFISTDVNPFYDSFVRWQSIRLEDRYMKYGEENLKKQALEHLKDVEVYSDEVRCNVEVGLQEHASSRLYGLGTKMPWDPQYLIESLSESTINMAYYTVSHLLHEGSLDGSCRPNNIQPEDMTFEVWDYIFSDAPFPASTKIPKPLLEKLKGEFKYWYPVDLITSGKDLVPNHLTYCLYNHAAMWPEDKSKWPRAIRANGHLLINGEKMSTSTGNFCTLSEMVSSLSADVTRLYLANTDDSIEDAEFDEMKAENELAHRLYLFLNWVKEMVQDRSKLRKDEETLCDKVFACDMDKAINHTKKYYEEMKYKEAVWTGFYEFQAIRDKYRKLEVLGMRCDLVFRFIELQAIIFSPICPHICESIWQLIGKEGYVVNASWPSTNTVDEKLRASLKHLVDVGQTLKIQTKKLFTTKKVQKWPTHATIWVATTFPLWQTKMLKFVKELVEKHGGMPEKDDLKREFEKDIYFAKFPSLVIKSALQRLLEHCEREGTKFLDLQGPENNEFQLIDTNRKYLIKILELDDLEVRTTEDAPDDIKDRCIIGRPFITYGKEEGYVANASWLSTNAVDENLRASSQYLVDVADHFRMRIDRYLKKKQVQKWPTHATIWVAKTYPSWQNSVLKIMKELVEKHSEMPDDRVILTELQKDGSFKKDHRKAIQLALLFKENYSKKGMKALDLVVELDEMEILNSNKAYLIKTLELVDLEVRTTEDAVDDAVKDKCTPGRPLIIYREEIPTI